MEPHQLNLFTVPGIPLISKGDDLVAIFADALSEAGIELQDGDVVVVAQKLVCLLYTSPSPRDA